MTQPTTTISLVLTFPTSSAHGLAFGLGGGLRDVASWLAEAARKEENPLGTHTIEPVPGHPLTFTIIDGPGSVVVGSIMTEAQTPEEIAERMVAGWSGPLSIPSDLMQNAIAQALRAYGDRRYCEARDAAAKVAEDKGAAWDGRSAASAARTLAEAIRKHTPEGKP